MAPVISYNASSGSDTAASGAGPAVAITGSGAAHTSGVASTTIQLTNSPDLSGVATDGSAAIWLNTPSGSRHLSKITAVDDGADTVTVEDSFNIASGGSAVDYAIGGERASLVNDTDRPDWEDILTGWVFEFAEGVYDNGSLSMAASSSEIFTFKAVDDYSTRPIIRSSASYVFVVNGADHVACVGLYFDHTNDTSGYCGYIASGGDGCRFEDCYFKSSGLSSFLSAFRVNTGTDSVFFGCVFDGGDESLVNTGSGFHLSSGRGYLQFADCVFKNAGSHLFYTSPTSLTAHAFARCIFHNGGGDGIHFAGSNLYGLSVSQCTIYGVSGAGILALYSNSHAVLISDCIISECGGYGIDTITQVGGIVTNCVIHNCTSGVNNTSETDTSAVFRNIITDDPELTDPENGDFTLGSTSAAIGAGTAGQDVGYWPSAGGGGGGASGTRVSVF